MTGIVLVGGASAERVFVSSPPALTDATGVVVGNGSALRESGIGLPNTTAAANDGIVTRRRRGGGVGLRGRPRAAS